MEQILKIELFGQEYKFRTKINKLSAREVASLLTEQVNKIMKQQPVNSSQINNLSVMIIAALNIANKNIELKKQSDLLNNISKKYEKLISDLDSVL